MHMKALLYVFWLNKLWDSIQRNTCQRPRVKQFYVYKDMRKSKLLSEEKAWCRTVCIIYLCAYKYIEYLWKNTQQTIIEVPLGEGTWRAGIRGCERDLIFPCIICCTLWIYPVCKIACKNVAVAWLTCPTGWGLRIQELRFLTIIQANLLFFAMWQLGTQL